jgi:hypothetical protein
LYSTKALSGISFNNIPSLSFADSSGSLIGHLTPSFIEHTPTSGLFVISLKVETWQLVQQQSGKLELTINPKHKTII